jgi:hypothetical protein
MSWEAVAALSTAFTGLVILATAVVAVREVRVASEHALATRDQLEHLRKATQFEGALAVFAELDTPFQQDARHFVQFELADRLRDDVFREQVSRIGGTDELVHKELTVLRCFERVGAYVSKGWVDRDVVCMAASGRVIISWRALHEVVQIHRSVSGPRFWENFERLYEDCKAWMRERGIDIDSLESRQIAALDHKLPDARV